MADHSDDRKAMRKAGSRVWTLVVDSVQRLVATLVLEMADWKVCCWGFPMVGKKADMWARLLEHSKA